MTMPTPPEHDLDARERDDSDRHDRDLVDRALDGDRRAFGELVRRHQMPALRLAAVIVGSSEEARDIVQEAFVKAYRGLAGFRGDAPVRPWLLRIVANEAKNHRRAAARRDRRELRFESLRLRAEPAPDDAAISADECRHLAAALDRLSGPDREVLAHRYVAGLTEAETADVIGVAIGTVKSRTARAIGRLRAVLGEEAGRG